MKKEYRGRSKCKSGPGGILCPCCSPMGVHPRKSKPLMRRIVRRVEKQKLHYNLEDYQGEIK